MAKLRLQIANNHIIISKIISIIINGVKFNKSDYTLNSRITQNF